MRICHALSLVLIAAAANSLCVNDEYCRSCPSGKCQYCAEGYVSKVNNTCTKSSSIIDRCVFYQGEGICEKCSMGHQVDSAGKCVPITIPNCVSADPETGTCSTCSAGILEKNGECLPTNKCTIANCNYCYNFKGLEYCYLCKQGYTSYIGPGTGPTCRKQVDDFTFNCDSAISSDIIDLSICLTCSSGYYYSIDHCVKSSKQIVESYALAIFLPRWMVAWLAAVLMTR